MTPADEGAIVQRDDHAETLARAVRGALTASPRAAEAISDPAPLRRSVCINPATWLAWFEGRRTARGRTPLAGSAAPAVSAQNVVRSLQPCIQPGHVNRGHVHVDRPKLLELSGAAADGQPEHLVSLWVATMMWGSGTTNGRGPWRTADGLADERLDATLTRSATTVRRGDLLAAHEGFELTGSGEAFFTKWFWAVSLTHDARLQPLILDRRVRSCLWHVLRASPGWSAPSRAAGYVAYLDLVDRATTRLERHFPGIAAEKVEWVLFEAKPGADGQLVLPRA